MNFVVNTRTNALTFYESFPFNSYAEFAGMYLAAGADGITQIDAGGLDGAAQIAASYSTGKLQLNSESISRVEFVYLGGVLGGDMRVDLLPDTATETHGNVVSPSVNGALHPCRAKLGRGARGRYWQTTVSNVDGCDFRIDTLILETARTARRV